MFSVELFWVAINFFSCSFAWPNIFAALGAGVANITFCDRYSNSDVLTVTD
jgi:hypothetical protein